MSYDAMRQTKLYWLMLSIPFSLSLFSIPPQWPKRTHTNHHLQHAHPVTSTTTKPTPTIDSNEASLNASSLYHHHHHHRNGSASGGVIIHTSSSTANATSDSVKNFISENGDIKVNTNNHSHSAGRVETLDSHSGNSSRKFSGSVLSNVSEESVLPTSIVAAQHKEEEEKRPVVPHILPQKKSKYQDFDASLVPDEGIFNSIMKVFGINTCPATPPDLVGPVEVDPSPEYMENVEKRLSSKVQAGGRYKPSECRARDRVAIVIPFRDRKQHLPILLKNLHPFLMKQQINYGIFLIEQSPDGSFNRAKLFNIGFVEALKLDDWDCFIFHDVDLLPMDDRNLYTCPDQPRHMSVAIDIFGFK
jgi:hypothetical protein